MPKTVNCMQNKNLSILVLTYTLIIIILIATRKWYLHWNINLTQNTFENIKHFYTSKCIKSLRLINKMKRYCQHFLLTWVYYFLLVFSIIVLIVSGNCWKSRTEDIWTRDDRGHHVSNWILSMNPTKNVHSQLSVEIETILHTSQSRVGINLKLYWIQDTRKNNPTILFKTMTFFIQDYSSLHLLSLVTSSFVNECQTWDHYSTIRLIWYGQWEESELMEATLGPWSPLDTQAPLQQWW